MSQPSLHLLDQALSAAVAAVAPSVVRVARGRGGGTGIAWAADLVVTASYHTPDRTRIGIATEAGELDERAAEVIGRDPGTDVALLRVAGGGLQVARFREADGLGVGNLALAIGRPGRTARASLRAIGVLGSTFETAWGGTLEPYVESDRLIPRGFAGGPLVDADGAVIGMNTRTLVRGADVAVPTATLRRVIDELVVHGGIRRGYLGVGAYPTEGGALVAAVDHDGPAATAGIIPGDIIHDVAGEPVDGPDGLRAALRGRPDQPASLGISRGGTRQTVAVTLGSKA